MLYFVWPEHLQHKPALLNIFCTMAHFRKTLTGLTRVSFKASDKKKKKAFCHSLSLLKRQWQAWVFTVLHAHALKGSSRHNNRPPSLSWFSVQHPPPTHTLGAVVIEYDTGSTGKAGAHLNAQNVVFLLFSSNPDAFNSQPVRAAVTVATSSRLHPRRRCLCFH